jgi:hypothetical protein
MKVCQRVLTKITSLFDPEVTRSLKDLKKKRNKKIKAFKW